MANVIIQGMDELRRNLRGYFSEVTTIRERQRILLAGGRVVRNKARINVPESPKPHFYYPKKNKRIEIQPGNLKKSLYAFRYKSGVVGVGPRVIRPLAGKYDKIGDNPKRSSGFYAAALFKSAQSFRQMVTDAALSASMAQVNAAMQKQLAIIHKQYRRRYNL